MQVRTKFIFNFEKKYAKFVSLKLSKAPVTKGDAIFGAIEPVLAFYDRKKLQNSN